MEKTIKFRVDGGLYERMVERYGSGNISGSLRELIEADLGEVKAVKKREPKELTSDDVACGNPMMHKKGMCLCKKVTVKSPDYRER